MSGLEGETTALRELVHVLQDQLAKAEERDREGRQQLYAERDRSAAAEDQVRELRRMMDNDLAALRAELATVREADRPASQLDAAPRSRTVLGRLRDVLARSTR